jgi:hypothetical protein
MSGKCLSLDELKTVQSHPVDEPRRRHFDRCPRCRARFASYHDFLEPAAPAIGSRPREADAHLAATLDREIYGDPADEQGSLPKDEPEQEGLLGRFLQSLWRPALRPFWAVGIVVLAVFGIRGVRDWQADQGDRIILRQGPGVTAVAVEVEGVEIRPDGTVLLSWTSVADADRYQVSLLGSELLELHRLDAGLETSIAVSTDVLSELGNLDRTLFWQVHAFRGGDEIASSKLQQLDRSR